MRKSRTKKAIINFVSSFLNEIISLLVGLIVPRLILTNFGSAYNGITHSVSQFISYIALMRAGIGGVTRAALYKPLAEKNDEEVSIILASTEKFMRRIAIIFSVFVFVLACVYPLIVTDFDWLFTSTLIIIISFATFAEYYFGFTYQMLLMADQKSYIYVLSCTLVTVLNGLVSIVLINTGCSIHVVKLGNTLVSILNPAFLYIYVHKHYNIIKDVKASEDKISQRWDAFAHEVASFVRNNSDIVVLTLFSSLTEISVYTVYHYVTANIKKIMQMCTSGFDAAFGDMNANKEYDLMNENLSIYELIVFSMVSIIHSVTLVMIVSFVILYTKGVNDANYVRYSFAIVLVIASAFDCIRDPYKVIVTSAGHYKQTRNGAIAETLINTIVSIICVIKFGLIGVAIGSLCAIVFRTCQFVLYISKNIINRKISYFINHIVTTTIIMILTFFISKIYLVKINSWFNWIIYAAITTLIASVLTLISDYMFYRKDLFKLIKKTLPKKIK